MTEALLASTKLLQISRIEVGDVVCAIVQMVELSPKGAWSPISLNSSFLYLALAQIALIIP